MSPSAENTPGSRGRSFPIGAEDVHLWYVFAESIDDPRRFDRYHSIMLDGERVAEEAQDLSTPQLRGFLAATLPHYVVPATFVFLDALPMTPNVQVAAGLEKETGIEISPREPTLQTLGQFAASLETRLKQPGT